MLPFRVGQIARVTQLVTVIERTVFGGPHAGSRGCSPTGTHSGVEPVKRIYPPPITDSNDSQSLRTDTEALHRQCPVRTGVLTSTIRRTGRLLAPSMPGSSSALPGLPPQ